MTITVNSWWPTKCMRCKQFSCQSNAVCNRYLHKHRNAVFLTSIQVDLFSSAQSNVVSNSRFFVLFSFFGDVILRIFFFLSGVWFCRWTFAAFAMPGKVSSGVWSGKTLFLLIVWSVGVCPQEVGRLLSQRAAPHARVTDEVVPLSSAVARGSPHPSWVWRLRCSVLGESSQSVSA